MTIWWKTSEQIPGQRISRFLEATQDPDGAHIALFERQDRAHVGLTMNDLGNLAEVHREYLDHPLTPRSDKAWRQREFELALLGARRLSQKFYLKLHPAFEQPQQKSPEPALNGEGAHYYARLMQRLTAG